MRGLDPARSTPSDEINAIVHESDRSVKLLKQRLLIVQHMLWGVVTFLGTLG